MEIEATPAVTAMANRHPAGVADIRDHRRTENERNQTAADQLHAARRPEK